MPTSDHFFYDGYSVDPDAGTVSCVYAVGDRRFTEVFTFESGGAWDQPAVEVAVRILFLLAGVSYYKTTAAPVVDLGRHPTSPAERAFLGDYYVHGLGEFAYVNGLDLRGLRVVGPDAPPAGPARYEPSAGRPLVPFGGGIDSIVTVEGVARQHADAALCIVHPAGQRFAAIEDAAAVTGLPIRRIGRTIDPMVRRSAELGFLNGHVPVTAIITAVAVVDAVLDRRDAVVLSNEWSASAPTIVVDGRPINHQWSKGEDFERAFAELVVATLGPHLDVFSYLRPRTELWVGRQFAALTAFHGAFRSCNRAFHQDPDQRLDRWCARCDKCCFIDLVLAPFMARSALADVFGDSEPLDNPDNAGRFRALLGLDEDTKPFECVGDVDECRSALRRAARRPDRAHSPLLQQLVAELDAAVPAPTSSDDASLLTPLGAHHIPERYAPADLLVRAR